MNRPALSSPPPQKDPEDAVVGRHGRYRRPSWSTRFARRTRALIPVYTQGMDYSIIDFLGNVGVALILLAYLALQLERVSATSLAYGAMNAVGAALILVSLYFDFNLSAFLMELFWLLISLYGIGKSLLRPRESEKHV